MTDARASERITMTSGNLSCGAKREKPPRPEEQEESDPCKSPQCYSSSEDDSKTDSVKLCDKEWCWRCWRCGTALSASCIRGCWAPGHLLELVPLSTQLPGKVPGKEAEGPSAWTPDTHVGDLNEPADGRFLFVSLFQMHKSKIFKEKRRR